MISNCWLLSQRAPSLTVAGFFKLLLLLAFNTAQIHHVSLYKLGKTVCNCNKIIVLFLSLFCHSPFWSHYIQLEIWITAFFLITLVWLPKQHPFDQINDKLWKQHWLYWQFSINYWLTTNRTPTQEVFEAVLVTFW